MGSNTPKDAPDFSLEKPNGNEIYEREQQKSTCFTNPRSVARQKQARSDALTDFLHWSLMRAKLDRYNSGRKTSSLLHREAVELSNKVCTTAKNSDESEPRSAAKRRFPQTPQADSALPNAVVDRAAG